MKFPYTFLFVRDVEATTAWYRDVLGLPLISGPHEGEWSMLGGSQHGLGLDARHAAVRRARDGLPAEFCEAPPAGCYLVFEVEDVAAEFARAVAAGAEVVGEPWTAPSGHGVAWLRDPEGMLIELWQLKEPRVVPAPRARSLLISALLLTLATALVAVIGESTGAGPAAAGLLVAWGGWLGVLAPRARAFASRRPAVLSVALSMAAGSLIALMLALA